MEFKAESGAKVIINSAPFKDVMALKAAIGAEISKADFSFDFSLEGGFNEQSIDAAAIAKILLVVDSSPVVQDKIFTCLARCTYNGEKITENTFEPDEARGDFYPIVTACLKKNLMPFLKALISSFAQFGAAVGSKNQSKEKSQE
jgi:hypothetical protein